MSEEDYKKLVEFIFSQIDNQDKYDVWTDSDMILTDNEDNFNAFVRVCDVLGLDFATGTPTEDGEYYYLCFA